MDESSGVNLRRSGRETTQPESYYPKRNTRQKKVTIVEEVGAGDAEGGGTQQQPSSQRQGTSPFSPRWFGGGRLRDQVPSTVSSDTKRAEVDCEYEEKKTKLNSEMMDLEGGINNDACGLNDLRDEIARKEARADPTNPCHDADGLDELRKEIYILTENLQIEEARVKRASILPKKRIAEIKMELTCLEKKKVADIARLDDEQFLGSDEEGNGEFEGFGENNCNSRERIQQWKMGEEEEVKVIDKSQNDIMTSMAHAITTLTKIAESRPPPAQPVTTVTEKVLIRQSIGRDLPHFSGRPEEWPSFIATFKRTTDICGFTNEENVERIRKCLRGDAAKSVECLLVSPDSLPKVLSILEQKFGQADIVIRSLVTKTKAVPQVKEDKPQTMIEFGTAVVNLVATIKNFGAEDHLKNPVLLHELSEKLPPATRIRWEEKVEDKICKRSLDDFADWVEKQVTVACRMAPSTTTSGKPVEKKSQMKEVQLEDDTPTAAGLFTGQVKECIFCDKERSNHYSSDCYTAEKVLLREKKKTIKKKKVCFICLRKGHLAKNCKVNVKCKLCSKAHCKPMCPELPANFEDASPKEETAASCANYTCKKDVLLKTLVVRVQGSRGSTVVRLLMDEGSQHSNGKSTTISKVGGKLMGEEWCRNALFGGTVTSSKKVRKFKVELESLDGKVRRELVLRETPTICGGVPQIPTGPWIDDLKQQKIHLSDIQQHQKITPEIEVLIGSDYWGQLVVGKPILLQSGLVAVQTIFGWTLSGPVPVDSCAMTSISMVLTEASVPDLWSLETIGIQDPAENKNKEQKEKEAHQHFLDTVSRGDDGRYSVSLPWIHSSPQIPDNKAVALKRLESATAKLRSSGKYEVYNKIFADWLEEGFIEEVLPGSDSEAQVHYIPHRAVFKPESLTTPVRPVFDASCKVGRNPSLNDCLEKGPNLLELIPSILLRFREKKIGVISDVRKAFQMIKVDEADRNFLRFLWWEEEGVITKIYRHMRVVFGINCSPFLLAAVVEFHLKSMDGDLKTTAMKLLQSLYVDNCVTSVGTKEEFEDFKEKSIKIMATAQMELRQWECSTGEETRVDLQPGRCGLESAGHCTPQELTTVLGLKWDKKKDAIGVEIPKDSLPEKITKRTVLSQVQKIFDPMGFLSPATLTPKLIMQKAWEKKTAWDEELEEETKKEFILWWNEACEMDKIWIPRHAFGNDYLENEVQVHIFCDASKWAYSAAVFVRVQIDDDVSVQLLQAKTRVAPIKTVSIPRLELLGCTIASRLAKSVIGALALEEVPTYFWSDSSTAIAWIKRNDEWGTFVGNRVKEICTLTQTANWRHVPGVLNPADLPSRGCSPSKLVSSRWWEGPSWLKKSESDWPSSKELPDEELVLHERKKSASLKLGVTDGGDPWYVKRFSSFTKNVRVIAWIMRFLHKCKRKNLESGGLKRWELDQAELTLFKVIQLEVFPEEGKALHGFQVVKDSEGLIRVQSKLLHRQDTDSFRMPVLLPKCHPLVEQLIREAHLNNCHAGVQFLISHLREKVWILHTRRAIAKITGSCVRCRRFAVKKLEVPAAPLPEDRVKNAKTFQITGIDLAGPVQLKNGTKAWMVLFTCAVYRAVHLEVVTAISTEAFILALHRFVSRRGRPTTIYTDNGTNFVGADNAFKLLDWVKIQKETEVSRIEWRFIPPTAAWWGGWWERLIRSIKDLLKRMLGRRQLDLVQLETCLCDVETVINGRPLTYVTEDMEDLIPLTPAMFLRDIHETECPELNCLDGNGLRGELKSMRKLREDLRCRFRKEYLGQLVQRGKEKNLADFKVGDMVLIGADNKKRFEWPMARIVDLKPGKDGKIRVASVQTKNGILVRPLQRLFPLEVSCPADIPNVANRKKKKVAASKKNPEVKIEPAAEPEVKTRAGRTVQKPKRYGQWN